MADSLFIQRLQVPTLIGVLPQERLAPQTLYFDIELTLDIQQAASSDRLAHTVDYASVCQVAAQYIQAQSFELIETLAERLIAHLAAQFSCQSIYISITKQPIDMPNVDAVGVRIHRELTNARPQHNSHKQASDTRA